MSFLHPVRIAFAGQFQADVSTVNNDVRHYDDAAFKPNFQQLATDANENGWWNPTGSGAYRLVNCRVTGVGWSDGSWVDDPSKDPAVGLTLAGAGDRTAGKLVDVDPQWQLASAPWGLAVRLLRGADQVLGGEYKSNAFRDLWFGRNVNSSADGAASSTFQSVLDQVAFEPQLVAESRALTDLFAITTADRLSIRFATFGYDGSATSPTFTLGTLIGTIGPYLDGEPESFVYGRRFAPATGFSSFGANATFFSGLLDRANKTLLLDLSNALQSTDAAGTPVDIGTLSAGVLVDDSIVENTPITADNFAKFGEIPYRDKEWLANSGGVYAVRLSDEQVGLAERRPLALGYDTPFNPGSSGEGDGLGVVAIRETTGGLFAGAEPAVNRMDAGTETTVRCYAAKYGTPLPDQPIALRPVGPVPGQGAGPSNPDVDQIKVPDMGVPVEALTVPATVSTDRTGSVSVTLTGGNPGNPRRYLDGQMYLIDYRLPGQSNNSRQPFDFIIVHLRDAFDVPAEPTWRDVKPILTQFSNLYPIMSQGFIDLADEKSVVANKDLLEIAFSRPIEDPNYMPVSRDLSGPKQQMILRWLRSLPSVPVDAPARRTLGATTGQRADAAPGPADEPEVDSKTRFAEQFLGSHRHH